MDSQDGKHSFMIPSRDGKYAADTLKAEDTVIFNWDSADASITTYRVMDLKLT
jgi:phage gp45-like